MNIVGERQDTEKFVPMVIRNLINNEPIPVHATKNSTGWKSGSRFYLHARNQADALLHLISNRSNINLTFSNSNKVLEKFHIVGEKELSNEDMVNLLASFMDKIPNINFIDFHTSRPGHDLRYALDGTKMANFGWIPPIPLEESLKRTVGWYKSNNNWLF